MATEQRLIDANKLWNALPADDGLLMYQVKRAIRDAPTVDAVEVVRCKDCKHYSFIPELDDAPKCTKLCGLHSKAHKPKPDDFCSHGERRTDHV